MSQNLPEPAEPQTVLTSAQLVKLVEELDSEEGLYEFQTVWTDALAMTRIPDQRNAILKTAGDRLRSLMSSDDRFASRLDRTWLAFVAGELETRPSDELASQASRVLQNAFARGADELQLLQEHRDSGGGDADFIRQHSGAAASVRDLGRIAARFRASDVRSLSEDSKVRLAVDFADRLSQTSRPTVGDRLRISRDDLLEWSDRVESASELPRLVRRLVSETTNPTRCHFPAGSGVAAGGWDGVVEVERGNSFVPSGASRWELSNSAKAAAKAAADYSKRAETVADDERRSVTYVQLICRQWTKASHFESEMKARGDFAGVKALNVDDVEAWLEHAPATTVWLREVMELPTAGVRSLSNWWKSWLASTTVPLDAEIVLAGRQRAAQDLVEQASATGVVTIGGEVRVEEVLAFVAAAASSPNSNLASDPVVLTDETGARQMLQTPGGGLVLVLATPALRSLVPADTTHAVVVPVPGSVQADIVLEPVESRIVATQLKKLSPRPHESEDLGALARRSLLALRRHFAVYPDLHRPAWAEGAASRTLRRALLVGGFNGVRDDDRQAVSRLFGLSFELLSEDLRVLAAAPDVPVVGVYDERWHVISPADSWILIGNQIAQDDLRDFRSLAFDVLTAPDPLFGLEPDDRLRASLDGVQQPYSRDLRTGLSRSLALLGTLDLAVESGAQSGAAYAGLIVREVLDAANSDESFRTWDAIAPQLSLLAEASPDALLIALRTALSGEGPLLDGMFRDTDRGAFGSPPPSPHTHFLWALEALAWSPRYLGDVCILLATLSELDPGGGWSNRPIESLKAILAPWHPDTSASVEERIKIVEVLRRRHPQVAWDLMVSMLPRTPRLQMVKRGPLYRDWKGADSRVTPEERFQAEAAACRALAEDVGVDNQRWVTLIERIGDIPAGDRRIWLGALNSSRSDIDDPGSEKIWTALRKFVSKHREFRSAQWAIGEAELLAVERVAESFVPTSAISRFGWLFATGMIHLDGLRFDDDREAFESGLAQLRLKAVEDLLTLHDFASISDFAKEVEAPWLLGEPLSAAADDRFVSDALRLLRPTVDEAIAELVLSYLGSLFKRLGWTWLETTLAQSELPPAGVADVLRATRDPAASRKADELGNDVSNEFWLRFSILGLGPEFPDAITSTDRLMGVGRVGAALSLLSLYSRRNRDQIAVAWKIAEVLEQVRDGGLSNDLSTLDSYEFENLLSVISIHADELGLGRVAAIEWFFLPFLGHDPDAKTLHRALSEDANFFAEIVELLYRPTSESGDEVEPTDEERGMAGNAFRLLQSWSRGPGVDQNGSLDESAMIAWVDSARARLARSGRLEVGDGAIGEALASTPADAGGLWPGMALRRLLEETSSNELDRGIERKIYNRRGPTSRSLDAGGKQEWALADEYRSRSADLRLEWPRASAIFSGLAETYEAHARREDAAAERRKRGLDR